MLFKCVIPLNAPKQQYFLGQLYEFSEDNKLAKDKHFVCLDVQAEPMVAEGPTKRELMAELDELGVPYKPIQNKAELSALLAAAKQ